MVRRLPSLPDDCVLGLDSTPHQLARLAIHNDCPCLLCKTSARYVAMVVNSANLAAPSATLEVISRISFRVPNATNHTTLKESAFGSHGV